MDHLRFLDQTADLGLAFPGSYDPALVTLSVLIASLAAYAALGIAPRISAAEGAAAGRSWLVAGAVAMGIGVWAMHFIGMLAFRLPVPVAYDVSITLLSMFPAIVASGVVLFVISHGRIRNRQLVLAGILMGLGIGTMHYTGMAAMRMAAKVFYEPALFALSIIVAAVLATSALYINFLASRRNGRSPDHPTRLGGALVMGFAVAGMHYTAMAAAYFFPMSGSFPLGPVLDPMLLASLVALASALILALTIFVAVVDSRLKAAAHSARTSRRRMIAAIEGISEGFCLYDADDKLVLSNSKYRELLHSGNGEVSLGESFEEIIRRVAGRGLIPEAKERVDDWVEARLKQHRDPSGPLLQRRDDGRWIQVSERKTEDGSTVAIYNDITDLKKAELELSEALENLKSAQAQVVQSAKMSALGKLTAGIVHEINTPVGVVNSSADNFERCINKIVDAVENSRTLEEVRSNKTFQKSIQIVRENSRIVAAASSRIGQVVGNLKNFAGQDAGTYQTANVHEGIENVLALVHFEKKEGVRVAKKFGDLPEVHCNPGELSQVFMTLLTNAFEAVGEEGLVTVETWKDGTQVHIKISDTGKGMPEDKVRTLFDLSFQTKGSRVGVGLGLSNAYNVVKRHNGAIAVASELGSGTEFLITLPVGQVQASTAS